MKAAI